MEELNSELKQANKYTEFFNKMKAKKFRNCSSQANSEDFNQA